MPKQEADLAALTVRWAVVLIIAVIATIVGGVLMFLATHNLPFSVFIGCGTFVAAWNFGNQLISK